MWKNVPIRDFQKDVDDGWKEFCDSRIAHFRKLSLCVRMEYSKKYLLRQINHWKIMRRIR